MFLHNMKQLLYVSLFCFGKSDQSWHKVFKCPLYQNQRNTKFMFVATPPRVLLLNTGSKPHYCFSWAPERPIVYGLAEALVEVWRVNIYNRARGENES